MNGEFTLNSDPTYPWSAAGFGLPLLIAVALLLTGLTVWTYLGSRGSTFRRLLAVLALRLGALLLAFLALLRPALAFRGELRYPSVLVIAVDDSESMTIQDEFDGRSRWERAQQVLRKCEPELRKLREEHEVTVVLRRFSEAVRPLDPEDGAAKADGRRSDYGLMMRDLFDRHGGERYLRGLVVMGDGAQNGVQPDPLAVAGEWRTKCPVHTFVFGKTTTSDRQSDIALTDISIDRSPIPAKGKFVVTAVADAPGFENREVVVRLFIDDKQVPVLIGDREEMGHVETLRLTAGNELKVTANAPAQAGEIKVTLKIDKLEGELVESNNEIGTFATVSQEGVGVLYVDKRREERAFILEALASDPRIRVDRVTLGGAAPAEGSLLHLDDRAYDVIILGDVTADEVRRADPGAPTKIKRLVQEKGAGVMMIGGRRNFGNGRWQGKMVDKAWTETEVRDVLPVDLSASGEVGQEAISLVRTAAGMEHFLLRLADDPRENKTVWDGLKLYGGAARMGRAKNGTAVLLRSSEGDDILVVNDVGGGRSAAFAGDTTYLWVRPPKGDQYHQRFWRQLVLWLAHQEKAESKLWVKPDARRVKAGRRLGFSAGIRGKDGLDLKGATIDAKVVGPGPAQLWKTRDRDEERIAVEASAPGEYQLVVEGQGRDAEGQEVRGKETVRFLVSQDDAEMTRRAADHEFLKRLAAAGGGKFHPGDEEELARYLRDLPSQPLGGLRPKPNLWPDWRRAGTSAFLPAFLLVFVALVSLEWFFRRRWGMA
jgi:uncharacterized membrane protein